jgi:hypothetical protein
MAQNRKARYRERRSFALKLARRILLRVVNGNLDAHEGCAQIRTMYLDDSALLTDFEPLATVASDRSSEDIRALAKKWLAQYPAEP